MSGLIENWKVRRRLFADVDGEPCIDRAVLDIMLSAPFDILPDFRPPPGITLRGGRGKDHPRYGRFVYALARHCRPDYVVEVGTFSGGTAVGWAAALKENRKGRLICVDNDTYSKGTYPTVARENISRTGLPEDRYELLSGDSKEIIPSLVGRLQGRVGLYLVDGDHTFEGARADIRNGLPMVGPGGFVLVHDLDRRRRMDEQTPEHPHPVHEAFMEAANEYRLDWCILRFIRKHLGLLRVSGQPDPEAAAREPAGGDE